MRSPNGGVVIVGAGQAGVSCAFRLRALGYDGEITIAGGEPHLPYHRPPLSKKYLSGDGDAARLLIKSRDLYESERIRLRVDCPVVAIHREEKHVELADGGVLGYDHLILATGARPRCLPVVHGARAPKVHLFRTLADAEALRETLVRDRHLLVVGGGYIGLETAAVARNLGMRVTVIERDQRILSRVACAETAAYFRALHEANGVRMHEGVALTRLEQGENGTIAARLSNGVSIEPNVVVAGVGVVPETGLAGQAHLLVDNGIVVDESGRTSDPFIYAAGDCARFPYRGQRVRLESVQNAVDMAEAVARAIVGESVEYRPVPWFWSDQYSTRLQIAGLNLGYTHVAVRKAQGAARSVWYYEGPRLLAVDAINDTKAFMSAKRWLEAGWSPVAHEIENPNVALADVSLSGQSALIN